MIPFDSQSRGESGRMVLLRHIERTGCTIAEDPVWTDDEITRLCAGFPTEKLPVWLCRKEPLRL
jgi:hypothetical protein